MKEIKNKLSIIVFYSSIIILYITLLSKSQDNDMWFEIMSGRDILNGNFHTVSHLDNFPIIVQQWLYAVIMALFDKLGTTGHILLVFIQDLILITLSSVFIYKKTNKKKWSIIGSIIALLYCHDYMINIRPQIITVILLVSELLLLEYYKSTKKNIYLFGIIPILVLAANMHQAVFLYHIFILIPYYISIKTKQIDWKLIVFTPLYILCSILTPYGINGSLYIVNTFRSNAFKIVSINEIQPLSITSYIGVKLVLIVAFIIFYNYLHKSNQFINFYVFSVFILSLINVRHISIEFIAIIFIISNLSDIKISIFTPTDIRLFTSLLFILLALAFMNKTDMVYGNVANIIPEKDARIYNSAMDIGGWLEYNGYTKVKIDSRCEAFSKEISGVSNILEEYFAITQGYWVQPNFKYTIAEDNELLLVLNNYDYIVAKENQYINRVLQRSNDWTLIFNDGLYTIYHK